MKIAVVRSWIVVLHLMGTASGAALAADSRIAEPITGDAVTTGRESKGIVLIAVRWDRRWKCGAFENAQLSVIGFDKLPTTKVTDDADVDIVLDDAPRIATKPEFETYAFLVDPGEYGLTRLEIKVARSVSAVGFFRAPRSKLLVDGKSRGGAFTVGSGEVVYVGHFYLDCHRQPILWRYYPDGREAFNEYLASLKNKFPALDAQKVAFRLFQTKEFGHEYKLP